MEKTTTGYEEIVKSYLKEAWKHYDQCKVIPDNEDLAGAIYDYWGYDSGMDLTAGDYLGILRALRCDFEDEREDKPGFLSHAIPQPTEDR